MGVLTFMSRNDGLSETLAVGCLVVGEGTIDLGTVDGW